MTPTEIHQSIKNDLKQTHTNKLRSLEYFAAILPSMPHYQLSDCSMAQKAIDADTLRFFIQGEMYSRNMGELPYSYGEMYLKVGIPKEFLK